MKNIKTFRRDLGISQEEFAEYLGVSRAFLSRIELGKKSLPTPALLKVGALEKYLEKRPLPTRTPIKERTDWPSLEYSETRIAKGNYQLWLLEDKLQKMRASFSEMICRYKILEIDADATDDLDSLKHYQKMRMERELEKCDPAAQETIKIKIAVINAELNALKEYQKKYHGIEPA